MDDLQAHRDGIADAFRELKEHCDAINVDCVLSIFDPGCTCEIKLKEAGKDVAISVASVEAAKRLCHVSLHEINLVPG
jgi:hypothetical protein